ncbi:MAG: transporter [Sphingomonas bacterium]|nr:transporter [Sphingomonas bacterium]
MSEPVETPAAAPWPSPGRAWYAVGVFTVALMFNFLDRQILALLVEPIKRDLGISDTQVSLLIGFAFVTFYLAVGIPIARLADRGNRKLILSFGIGFWSLMTAACGLAGNFWQLALARAGVGLGESCNGPATYSILSDLFPKEKLAKAISVLNFGFMFGQGGALIVGGSVVALVATMPDLELPVIGRIHAWQMVFLAVGLPGLLVSLLLLLTVPEPARRGRALEAVLPFSRTIAFMGERWRTYLPLFGAMALRSMVSFGIAAWAPAMFMRSYGWTPAKVGLVQGSVILVLTPIGLYFGGWLAERLAKRGQDDANLRVTLLSSVLLIPFAVLFPLMPSAELAIVLLAANLVAGSIAAGPNNAALQVITPNRMRGQISALFIAVFNMIGYGVGPLIVALITDYAFGNEAKLNLSIAIVAAIFSPLSALLTWWGMRPYAESLREARSWDA